MSQNIQNLAPLPAIGTKASLSRTITEDDILLFALVSGDHNPIHLDAEYAEKTLFGKRIAHGFLIGSLISAVLGNDMPGPGSIYLGQTLKFLAPIHIGDTRGIRRPDEERLSVGYLRWGSGNCRALSLEEIVTARGSLSRNSSKSIRPALMVLMTRSLHSTRGA